MTKNYEIPKASPRWGPAVSELDELDDAQGETIRFSFAFHKNPDKHGELPYNLKWEPKWNRTQDRKQNHNSRKKRKIGAVIKGS